MNQLSLGLSMTLVVALSSQVFGSALFFGPNENSLFAGTNFTSQGSASLKIDDSPSLGGNAFESTGISFEGTYAGWLSGQIGFSGGRIERAFLDVFDLVPKTIDFRVTAFPVRQSASFPVSAYLTAGWAKSEFTGSLLDYIKALDGSVNFRREAVALGAGIGYEAKLNAKSKLVAMIGLENVNDVLTIDTIENDSNSMENFTELNSDLNYVYAPEAQLSIVGSIGSKITSSRPFSWRVGAGLACKL